MIDTVLWDNDGVLLDTEILFFETTRAGFNRYGLDLTKEMWGRHYLGEGKSSREIAAQLGAERNRIEAMLDERNQQYREVLRKKPPLRPQVLETLNLLYGRVRMAMVTGSHRDQLQLMHRDSGLLEFFDAIVTGDECSQPKPHPELYLAGLKALGANAQNCIAVEDSPRGLAAARAAGIACIVVPTELTHGLDFVGALSIEPDVSGVLRYVHELD
jgi:HAD superfamily hydrolase (TIGR01509 family)